MAPTALTDVRHWAASTARSSILGYGTAVLVPIATILAVAQLRLPEFIFERLTVLVVVGFSVAWGIGPAVVAAIVAVSADNVLLRDPSGQPTITGVQDVIDLGLFVAVAVAVAWLIAKARRERSRAEAAAERERRARADRDRLIATVSHDLATPLAAIRGTLQFARRFGTTADIDFPRVLVRLETATARATSLVNTLADAQALDSGGLALTLGLPDLRDVVAPVVRMLDRVSDRHSVALTMPDTAVVVRADAERLQRVVENLVGNAIKYSPHGGAVEVSLAVEDDDAVLTVRDYGIGISAEALPHIFERSYRAPEAAAAAPGLGLGLNIAAQIAARHGGIMDARAADPHGAIISLRLPLHRSDAASPAVGLAASHDQVA